MTTSSSVIATACVGSALSVTGTAMQTDNVLQWISIGVTIVGAIISFIVIPILNWYKDNKNKENKDVGDLMDTIKTGLDEVKDVVNKERGKDENANDDGNDKEES